MAAWNKKHKNYRPFYSSYYKSFRRFIIPIAFILGILGYAIYHFLGSLSLIVIIPLTLALILYINLEVIHQVSLIAGNHYQFGIQQAQSIHALYHTLNPEFPLPSMAKWAGNPDFCLLTAKHILSIRPRVVLELGGGASTIIAGLALRRTGGRLISIDHDDTFLKDTVIEINHHNLSDIVKVFYCPLADVTVGQDTFRWYDLSSLDEIPVIDFLIIDGPPGRIQEKARYPALPILYDKLAENAIILLDDGRRNDEKEIVKMWKTRYENLDVRSVETEKGAFLLSTAKH